MKNLLLALAFVASSAFAQTASIQWTPRSVLTGDVVGDAQSTQAKCDALVKTMPTGTYVCMRESRVIAKTEVCPALPAPTVKTIACPAGTTGSRTETTTYAMSTACVQSTSTATTGACVPVVTPPVTPPSPGGRVVYADKCIGTAASQLSPAGGETLVIRPGTYAEACDKLTGQGAGKAGAWNTIRAETLGTVVVTAGIEIDGADRYLQLDGIRWEGPGQKSIGGSYVKVTRSQFKDGPPKDNAVKLVVGTGAHHILLEDVLIYGSGGRYDLLVYQADKIVLRRVVSRHGGGWSDTKGDPEASISIYNSQDVLTQNLLILDSTGSGALESALYHPSNSDSHPGKNIAHVGAVIIGSAGNGVCWEDGASAMGMSMVDSVIYNVAAVGACTNSGIKQVSLRRVLISKTGSHGFAAWGKGTVDIFDSTLTGIGGELVKGTVTRTGTGMPVLDKRQGKLGALWGEAGYDQPQAEALLPYPLQDAYKAALCAQAVTPLCSAASISDYVRAAVR